jgi:4-amino-4-deoxy-L-arabinose transferase-like glycosyltransferase
MEARNFITAREMLRYNNWFHTTMNLEPRYEKPPLPTWLTAFSASIFGIKNLFGLRLPAAISVTFLIIISYYLSVQLFMSKKRALINALILSTSFFIIFSGRNGQWDIFAHAFMIFAIYNLFIAFQSKDRGYQNWIIAGIFIGLSFMSKGPVSLYALLLPFLLSYAIIFKFKDFNKKILPLVYCLIIFLVVGLSWGIYIYVTDNHSAQLIANKESLAWSNRNIRPWYYYWSFFTQSGLWTYFSFIGLLYPFMIKRVKDKKTYKFTFLWTVLTVVLLSLIPEKKSRYLLPVLIPLALNTGFYIDFIINKKERLQKSDSFVTQFGFGLIGIICLIFPLAGYFFFKNNLNGLWINYILTSVTLFTIGIYLFKNLILKKYEMVFYATILMMSSIMLFALPLAKTFYDNRQFNNISELRNNESSKNLDLYAWNGLTPELIWELDEPVKIIHNINELPLKFSFGLLLTDTISNEILQNYNLQPIDTFDINYIDKLKKGYKKRLVTKFYKATKK